MVPELFPGGGGPISSAEILFPDAKGVFGVRLKPLEEIKSGCLVVLDTNALLVPYTINPKGLKEVAKIYKILVSEKRLVIPAQVAREFAKQRPNKLTELYQQLTSKRSKLASFQKGRYPLLDGLEPYAEAIQLEKDIDDKIASYKAALGKVLDHIKSWIWNDPVSILYAELFTPDIVKERSAKTEDLKTDIKHRTDNKIPPGYKDAAKEDGGAGDIIIWHTILELGKETQKDVIFVSADAKADWFHQSDGALYPRFELVDEYSRASAGASFHMQKLSDFLDLQDAEKEVVEEIRTEEAKLPHSISSTAHSTIEAALIELAVKEWLEGNYPGSVSVESVDHPTLDRTLLTQSDILIGITIKRIRRTSNHDRRLREALRICAENVENIDYFHIFIIADDISHANQLLQRASSRKSENGQNIITIGYVQDLDIFFSAGEVRIG